MLGHPRNKRSHFDNISDHLIYNVIKVASMPKVKGRVKSHLVVIKNQQEPKQWRNALG